MKAILPSFVLLLTLGCLFSCQTDKTNAEKRIVSMEPAGEVPVASNLTLTFNANLVADSMLTAWDQAPWLEFDPPLSGSYRWIGRNTLMFSPNQALPAGTSFKVMAGAALLDIHPAMAKQNLGEFQTVGASLQQVRLHWETAQTGDAVLMATLLFSEAVDATEASRLTRAETNGRVLEHVLNENGITRVVRLQLPNAGTENTDIAWRIAPGLQAAGGNLKRKQEFRFVTQTPQRDQLVWQEMDSRHDGAMGTVELLFNQVLQDPGQEALTNLLTIQPSIAYEASCKGNVLTIRSSAFAMANAYRITLKPGLVTTSGVGMPSSATRSVNFGSLAPTVAFAAQRERLYLPANGSRNLAVRLVAVPEVIVTVYKVFANNLPDFLERGVNWNGYWDDETDDYYSFQDYRVDGLGDEVYQEHIQTADLPLSGEARLLTLDFKDRLERFDGFYVVQVQDAERHFLRDARIVSISDLGLMARVSESQAMVFANYLETAEPAAGIEVTFYSTHRQSMHTTSTDEDGVAIYEPAGGIPNNFQVGWITARDGSDFNALPLRANRVDASRFDVGGVRTKGRVYDAFLYGERDLYRPGETAHFAAIVRDGQDWDLPGSLPVNLQFLGPDGRTQKNIRQALDEQGAMAADLNLPANASTGPWMAQLRGGDGSLLASFRFQVEEFMPDRIRLHAHQNKNEAGPGDSIECLLQALNFFGPPAAGRRYEWQLELERKYFDPPGWDGWNFDPEGSLQDRIRREGTTDTEGKAKETVVLPQWINAGLAGGRVMWTVFDESGRPVYGSSEFTFTTQDIYPGMTLVDRYARTGEMKRIPMALVDAEGEAQQGELAVEVVKVEWENTLVKVGDKYRYRSNEIERVLVDDVLTVDGSEDFLAFTPRLSGRYRVRVRMPGSDYAVSETFYAYGWGNTNDNAFQVDNEGRITIKADADSYLAGDLADLVFETPFDGKLIVTVERERVSQRFILNTDHRSATVSLRLGAEYVPNVYVTATLLRPLDGSNLPLTVAHGFLPLRVEAKRHQLELTMEAPVETRSRRSCSVTVKTEPGARLTIAAVDEGILQISNFESPDPYAWFLRKQALEVGAYDCYAQLYPDLMARSGLSGGGDGSYSSVSSLRLNPVQGERVRLVSAWSGIIEADRQGLATFQIDLPAFSGELRWMAAAWKDDAFGHATTSTTVADPLVVSTALPRFLSPGDEVDLSVMLANTTPNSSDGDVRIETDGPLELVGEATQRFQAPGQQETQVQFKLRAKRAVGLGSVRVIASTGNESFDEALQIPVRPASGLLRNSGHGELAGGKTASLQIAAEGAMDTIVEASLVISRSPVTAFTGDLNRLLRYPHGCLEQTVSRAFPQLRFADLVALQGSSASGELGRDMDMDPVANVNQAIAQLQTLSISNGGMTYWPGSGKAQWWSSIYAAHFLLEAEKSGYAVDRPTLDRLLAYLRNQLRNPSPTLVRFSDASSREMVAQEVGYTLYVLALAGQPERASMNHYQRQTASMTVDSRYLLAAAFAMAGDWETFGRLLPVEWAGSEPEPTWSGSFRSALRDRAMVLNTLLDLDPDHPQIPPMARLVTDALQAKRWPNTQEMAFAYLALGKLAERERGNSATGIVSIPGQADQVMDGTDLVLEDLSALLSEASLSAEGEGRLYWFWEASGLSSQGKYQEEDHVLRVRKRFYQRDGTVLQNLNNIRQNDLLVVGVTLNGPAGQRIDNIAVSDLLPAGFEIENPRLREQPSMPWITKVEQPDYLDIRDDRIHFFTDFKGSTQHFYYLVRAVRPGNFHMGPVSADAMYNGAFRSYHGGGMVRILPR